MSCKITDRFKYNELRERLATDGVIVYRVK